MAAGVGPDERAQAQYPRIATVAPDMGSRGGRAIGMTETTMQPSARRLGTAIVLAALALALVVPAQGQPAKPDAHSGHHPPGAAPAPVTPPTTTPPATGMPGDQRGMMPMIS